MAVRKMPMALDLETFQAQEEPTAERGVETAQAHSALGVDEEVGVPDVPCVLIAQQASASSSSASSEAQAPAANPSGPSLSSFILEASVTSTPSPLLSTSPEPESLTPSPPSPTYATSRTPESSSSVPSSTASPTQEPSSPSPSTSTSSPSSLPAFASESEENPTKLTRAASSSTHPKISPSFHPPLPQQPSPRQHQFDRQQNSNAHVPQPTSWRKEHSGSRESAAADGGSGRRLDSAGSERAMLRCAPPGYLAG